MRLRWPWFAWTDQMRPWQGMALPCDATDMELFRASTDISIGDGSRCLFWHDRWLPGGALKLQYPELFAIATRKARTFRRRCKTGIGSGLSSVCLRRSSSPSSQSFGQPCVRSFSNLVRMRSLGDGRSPASTPRLRHIGANSWGHARHSEGKRFRGRTRTQNADILHGWHCTGKSSRRKI